MGISASLSSHSPHLMQTLDPMGLKENQGPASDIRSWHFNGFILYLPHFVSRLALENDLLTKA